MDFAAVFGRNAALSAAELHALCEPPGLGVQRLNQYAALVTGDILPLAERFGAITKIVQLADDTARSAEEAVARLAQTPDGNGKVTYGISSYGSVPATPLTILMEQELAKRGLRTRYMAKREGRSGRAKDGELSAVQVKHNRLLTRGYDWCVFETDDGWRYGRTAWVYDFEGFSRRDYDKPRSDPKRGMLPPQLARAMVNLATRGEEVPVYDPFCGIGSLLLESAALGHRTLGSDIDETAVKQARENLEWLGQRTPNLPEWQVTVHDATTALPQEAAVIATEGSLGIPVSQSFSATDLDRQSEEVSRLVADFFAAAKAALRAGDRLVITLPVWRIPRRQRLEVIDELTGLGYTVIRPFPPSLGYPGVSDRDSIEVARDQQKVVHELFIFERN